MKELLTLIIQNIESFELSAQFRKGQKPFYDAIIKSLKEDRTTMFVKGPTGMGKTFLEAVLAAALIGNSDIKILLLTSKITLLQQIQREFKRFVGFLKTGLFGGGFKNYHEQVTIMTYDSFRNLNENIAKQYSVVLLDEGHKGLGKKTKEQLEKQKNFSILIGFTASDEYSKEKSLTTFLLHKAHELSIEEAVEIGMLSNIKVMIASVDIEIDNQHTGESRGDYEERISSEIIREGGNIATARLYKRVFAKRNLRGIALVLTTLQGRDLVEECAKEGIKAELIHSGMKRAQREDMFTRFRNNEFTVLVGMGIIKEGFDDPGVSVAITTYPVSSRVDMTQFPGRAERIDEENPDKVAYIVNLAYKAKKQLFYTDILDGKSEVRQKKVRKKKLDIISSDEMQGAIATKPESYITNVAVSEEEVVSLVRDSRGFYNSDLEGVPQGWSTIKKLSFLPVFKNNDQGVAIIAERYRDSNPEYFSFHYKQGKVVECISPKLILILHETFSNRIKAPHGWITANKIITTGIAPVSLDKIEFIVAPYRKIKPHWFNFYWAWNRFAEFFHPELISIILKKINKIDTKKNGWESSYGLERKGFSNKNTLFRFVEKYRQTKPNWFKVMKSGKNNRASELYSPELVAIIKDKFPKKEINEIKMITSGDEISEWMTLSRVITYCNIGCSKKTALTFLDSYRDKKPNWFKQKLAGTVYREHFSPELICLLFNKYQRPFNGWYTANSISKNPSVTSNPNTIKKFAERYRNNQDWFKLFWLRSNFYEHYHPELIKLILKNCTV